MNNCIQPTASSLVLVHPNASVVIKGTGSMFRLQKIWREVCFYPMVGWGVLLYTFPSEIKGMIDLAMFGFNFSGKEISQEDLTWQVHR